MLEALDSPSTPSPTLTWLNVLLGLLFIIFDSLLSFTLGLGIGGSLLVAATRCILQLSVMGLILDRVFASQNIWGVVGIALLLNVLGAVETTYNKAKRRFTNMFPLILTAMLCGTIPISILGTNFAMSQHPFWQPDQYIPILGMILGNAISAIGVGMNTVSREFSENKDKVETYLAMGASRWEACKPIAVEALKLALLPTINQMSVIGLISIPGMMTGAIVGGKSVEQAARLQMIIMFSELALSQPFAAPPLPTSPSVRPADVTVISASSALCTLAALIFAMSTLCDDRHRLRPDRMTTRKPAFYRWRDGLFAAIWASIKTLGMRCAGKRPVTEGVDGQAPLHGE